MPAKKGEPILNGLSISIPGFVGIYKILFIAILIFPWYVILSNKNIPGIMFSYLIGKEDIQKNCPPCKMDISKCPLCIEPKQKCPIVEPCPGCPAPQCPACECKCNGIT